MELCGPHRAQPNWHFGVAKMRIPYCQQRQHKEMRHIRAAKDRSDKVNRHDNVDTRPGPV
jgi:hypothetical protein